MNGESQLTLESFERGDVDAGSFDHEAHVYIAWLYISRYDLRGATERFSAALKLLTRKLGVPQKYHATLTQFWMHLIAERTARDPEADWTTFRQRNQDLFRDAKAFLRNYYTDELLASKEARLRFTEPDKQH